MKLLVGLLCCFGSMAVASPVSQVAGRTVAKNLVNQSVQKMTPDVVQYWFQKISWYNGQTTALGRAIEKRDLPLVEFIVTHGDKVFIDSGNEKYLHIYEYQEQSRKGELSTEVASLEFDRPSWVDVLDARGRLPLTMAAAISDVQDSTKMMSLLLEHDAAVNVLARGSLDGRDRDVIHGLASPLAHTVTRLNVAGVKLLLNKGADPNLFDGDYSVGTVPLYLALMRFDSQEGKEIVTLLLEHGANINLVSGKRNQSIFHRMITYNAPVAAVRFAIANGADVNHADEYGATALNRVAASPSDKSRKYLRILLQIPGIDLNSCGLNGETPLMVAAKNANFRTVRKLVRHGANTRLRNNDGDSARNLAEKRLRKLGRSKLDQPYRHNYQQVIRFLERLD